MIKKVKIVKINFLNRNESRTYSDAKEFVKNFNIRTQREYSNFITGKTTEYNLPGNPRKFYKEYWLGWGDYLSTNRMAFIDKKFYSYDEIKKILEVNCIDSKRKYQTFYKNSNDDLLPSNLDKTYKNFSWYNILDKQKPTFLSFEEGRSYSRTLKIKSVIDYYKYIKENNISFLPITPDKVYKDKWTTWMESGFKKQIIKDKIKDDYCLKNNIKLIRISYLDIESISDILKKELIK